MGLLGSGEDTFQFLCLRWMNSQAAQFQWTERYIICGIYLRIPKGARSTGTGIIYYIPADRVKNKDNSV